MKLGVPSGVYSDHKISNEPMKALHNNQNLLTLDFNNNWKLKQFLKENKMVFGDIDPIYHCMAVHFKNTLKVYNPRFYTLDIEVYAKSEFPDPHKAEYVMNLITICDYQKRKYYSWGLKPFDSDQTDYDVEYTHCNNEIELIENIIEFIQEQNIKCFTGWNTEGFDVPYIINRMKKFSHKSFTIKEYFDENINSYGKKKSFITIQVIDYMELYKKFKGQKLERYSLDFVAQYEGFKGKKKLDCSLADASDNRWNDYVLYNIIDNEKIVELEDKLKYIKQAFSMANDNRCLPTDVYSPVKMWDAAVYFELYHRGILVPPRISETKMKLLGGYVGQPVCSEHKYLSVFDISSSYPHQIMQFNISPETVIGERKLHEELKAIRDKYTPTIAELDSCTDKQFSEEWKSFKKTLWKKEGRMVVDATKEELNIFRVKFNIIRFYIMSTTPELFAEETAILVKHNVCMTPNLQFYRKDRKGIFPELMERYFGVRNIAKRNEGLLKYHIDLIKKQIGIFVEEEEKLESFADACIEDDDEENDEIDGEV